MNILLLGHKGMLGSDLYSRLALLHDVTGKDIEDLDITQAEACLNVISETEPDIVINAAAYTDVDACESNREKCFSVNAESLKNIAYYCHNKGIKIVHFSSDYVFDGQKNTPYLEDDKCNPLNVYGESKMMGEHYLQKICDDYLLIRSSWLYGRNGKNFVKTIVEKAQTQKIIEVVTDQTGAPTYTWDLAAAVIELINRNLTGVFHVTNRGSCSWYEFAKKIVEFMGATDVRIMPISSVQLNRPARRPHYSVLGCRKLINQTGKTMRFWQVALGEYLGKTGY